jgi:tRNA1Val (adenine37-N6)-methyltransferase
MNGSDDPRVTAQGGGRGDSPPPAPDRLEFASLSLRQPEDGYRFSIDSVLLADFASARCAPDVLDLGTGCGVVLLLLARKCPGLSHGVGVEIQQPLFDCARANIAENGLGDRLAAIHGDFRQIRPEVPAGRFGLVVSNPPFRRAGEGRQNPDSGRAIARHELAGTLPELFAAAGRALAPKGRFALVALASRTSELFACAAAAGIVPEALRFVHPYADRPAGRVLFAGRKGGRARDTDVLPPLVEYASKGVYHAGMERVFEGMLRK